MENLIFLKSNLVFDIFIQKSIEQFRIFFHTDRGVAVERLIFFSNISKLVLFFKYVLGLRNCGDWRRNYKLILHFSLWIVTGDGVTSTGESLSAVQARQEEARRKRRRKKRSGTSLVSSCFQGKETTIAGSDFFSWLCDVPEVLNVHMKENN